MSLIGLFTSISDAFKSDAPTDRGVLCPHCESPLSQGDHKDCARKGMTRRFFFGLAGASAAALALRVEGVPIPAARVQVIARTRDAFDVFGATGPFTIAWESAKESDGSAFETPVGLLRFDPKDASLRVRVNPYINEMRILDVVDERTQKPLKYRIWRAAAADEKISVQKAAERAEREARAAGFKPAGRFAEMPHGIAKTQRWEPQTGDCEWYRDGFRVAEMWNGGVRTLYQAADGYEWKWSMVSDSYLPVCKECAAMQTRAAGYHERGCTVGLSEKYAGNMTAVRARKRERLARPVGVLPA